MNTIKENMLNSTHFIINPCLEFVSALRTIGDEKKLRTIAEEMNFQITDEDNKLIGALKEKISKYVLHELKYFFDIVPIYIYPAAFIADYEELNTVEALLNKMENADLETVFKYLGGIFIGEYVKGFHEEWEKVDKNINKMRLYIENADIEEKDKKEKLLECMQYPEETKQRLCFLFRQFYEKSYCNIEKSLLEALQLEKEKYTALFKENPEAFYSKYFSNYFSSTDGQWNFKVNIHVSILYQITFWTLNLHDYIKKPGIVILGARMDKFENSLETNAQVNKFLKVLSDKRRVDIIKLLSQKSYYGYEFAGILKLTPATVNYHMSFILDAGLVSIERRDNKILYNLDKGKVKLLLKEMGKILLKE